MMWYRWLFLGLGILILGFCIYLIILNRGSESIQSKSFTVVFVGALGLLISLLFGLKGEKIEEKIQFSFFFQRFPFELIDMSSYVISNEIPSTDFNRHRVENFMDSTSFKTLTAELDASSQEMEFLNDLLVRKFFDILLSKFHKDWNIDETGFLYPYGYAEFNDAKNISAKEKVFFSLKQLQAIDPRNPLISQYETEVSFPEKKELGFYLPPKSSLVIDRIDFNKRIIKIENPFVVLKLDIDCIYYGSGIGKLNLPEFEGIENIYSIAGIVKISVEFNPIRMGHPDMVDYESWVTIILDRYKGEVSSEGVYKNLR